MVERPISLSKAPDGVPPEGGDTNGVKPIVTWLNYGKGEIITRDSQFLLIVDGKEYPAEGHDDIPGIGLMRLPDGTVKGVFPFEF